MNEATDSGPRHDGGFFHDEMLMLAAARRLLQSAAVLNLSALQADLSAPAVSVTLDGFNRAVIETLVGLVPTSSGTPAPPQVAPRNLLWRLARERASRDGSAPASAARELQSECVEEWLSIWAGRDDAGSHQPFAALLRGKAEALAAAAPCPEAALNRLVSQALRDRAVFGMSRGLRRNWNDLLKISHEILGNDPTVTRARRCSIEHFREILAEIRRRLAVSPNNRWPRTLEGIAELFWQLCSCCVGITSPPMPHAIGAGGRRVARYGGEEGESEASLDQDVDVSEQAAAVFRAGVDPYTLENLGALYAERAHSEPTPLQQIVLAHHHYCRSNGSLAAYLLAGDKARARYPWFTREILQSTDDRDLAKRLGVGAAEFEQARKAVLHWHKATVRALCARGH